MNTDLAINFREQLNVLPVNLAGHLLITVVALAVGVAFSLPLGILVARRPRLRYPTLTAVGLIQTIPSLALLALMVPVLVGVGVLTSRWLGVKPSALGFWPAVIALTLYSMLPMVRNTVTGLLGVDPAVTEAAHGVGMKPWQVLGLVELPLAAPTIIAGVRTATVWVVGIATLSTPVGHRSLGNFIFGGLITRNWIMILVGCISAAALAVGMDLIIGGLERAWIKRDKALGIVSFIAMTLVLILGLAGNSLLDLRGPSRVEGPSAGPALERTTTQRTVRIGSKGFTEQYILAALMDQTLRDAGFQTQRVEGLGSTVAFDALINGEIDVYVDYSGTIWAVHMKRPGSAPPAVVLSEVTWTLAQQHGVRCLGALGFENAYALAMRRDRAQQLGVESIADLSAPASKLKIGGDQEFFDRAEWRNLREGYGLNFARIVNYDPTFMYSAVVEGDIDVASAYSSDGRIAAFDLVTLKDPRQVIPPYDAVLLLSPRAAADPALVDALRHLVGSVPVEVMRQANYMVDRDKDKKSVDQAAAWLREQTRR